MRNEQAENSIRQRFFQIRDSLNERARRLFTASEAVSYGWGGIDAVARATGMARRTIGTGTKELRQIEAGEEPAELHGRIRRPGAGRKKVTARDPDLLPVLKALVESTTRGDPESPLLWTARSQRNLINALKDKGYKISRRTLANLLKKLGYSLQGNRKCLEGSQHPDRNAQFEHISEAVRQQVAANEPAISVDTKKRELVGPYENGGRELRPKGDPEEVNVHDFKDKELGHVRPYGVYDLENNEGWVNVGINHDTAEFAVEGIRSWWHELGQARYPHASSLLITADGGGSNGYRTRLWKVELQKLVNELSIPISVCHFPPGTSKWNKIEHRLFSFITKNWRGKPLVTHQVIVNLIASTKTETGLTVRCRLDQRQYAKGRRISDKQLAEVHIVPNHFHGEWNYTIHPSIDIELMA
jgi:hypothetical protein